MDYKKEILEILDNVTTLRADHYAGRRFIAALQPRRVLTRVATMFVEPIVDAGLVKPVEVSAVNDTRVQLTATIVAMSVADYAKLRQLADGLPPGIVDFTLPE